MVHQMNFILLLSFNDRSTRRLIGDTDVSDNTANEMRIYDEAQREKHHDQAENGDIQIQVSENIEDGKNVVYDETNM